MTLRRASAVFLLFAIGSACSGELRLRSDRNVDTDATVADVRADEGGDGASDTASDDVVVDTDEPSPDVPVGPCSKDADCRLPTLHCDPIAGCVPCVIDAHCPTKERKRCDGSLHRCVECGVTGDCAPGDVCDVNTRKCVETCTASTTCPPDAKTCDTARGLCVACSTATPCDPKRHCELTSGRCLECVSNGDCPKDHPRCDTIVGRCVTCLTSSDCPAKQPLCDPGPGNCVTG